MTVSGRNTRLTMSSSLKASRIVCAHAGACSAVCRPERLIENADATGCAKVTVWRLVATERASADELVRRLRDGLAARSGDPSEVLVHERAMPAEAAQFGVLRPHLPSALARALVSVGIRQLYAHQVATIEAL